MTTKEEQSLLDINFHDCYIVDIKVEKNNLIILIDIDTHWFPGSEKAKLKLNECSDFENFYKAWEEDIDGWIQWLKIMQKKNCYLFRLLFHSQSDKSEPVHEFILKSYNFER